MNYVIENPTRNFPALRLPPARPAKTRLAKPASDSIDYVVSAKGSDDGLNIDGFHRAQAGRDDVEQFIRGVFYQAHGATLKSFLPEIFGAKRDGKTVAAVGLRYIDQAPIFLEQYLEQPVEKLLSVVAGFALEREQIAEVGNLASHCDGSSRLLIAFLVKLLSEQNIEWVVCTGTNAVRAVMKRMGIEFEVMQKAEPESLGEDRFDWGNYYQHNPFVLAVNIPKALKVIQQKYDVENLSAVVGEL